MTHFGGIGTNGDVRRAHLALVGGTASTASESALVVQPVANHVANNAATAYGGGRVEAPRSRHESGVRAVARNAADFESALLPMILASGVYGEAAIAVAKAVMDTPALKAQAERAFQRANSQDA